MKREEETSSGVQNVELNGRSTTKDALGTSTTNEGDGVGKGQDVLMEREDEEWVAIPGQGSFPWERPDWSLCCGSNTPRLVPRSSVDKTCSVEAQEYLSEIQWLKDQMKFVADHLGGQKRRRGMNNEENDSSYHDRIEKDEDQPMKQQSTSSHQQTSLVEFLSPEIPTVAFLYRSTYRTKRPRPKSKSESSTKLSPNAIVLIPSTPSSFQSEGLNPRNPTIVAAPPSISCSSSFYAAFPEEFRNLVRGRWIDPDSKVLLAASRRLRRRYGELPPDLPQNPNLLIDPNHLDQATQYKSTTPVNTQTTPESSFHISTSNRRHHHRFINPHHPAPSSLLLDPMEPSHLSHLMQQHLQPTSSHAGAASPVSPAPNDSAAAGAPPTQPLTGSQPVMVRRNRSHLCILHHKQFSQTSTASMPSTISGWSWDLSEPLSLPGLCSCNDPHLYRLWQSELNIHKTICAQEEEKDNQHDNEGIKEEETETKEKQMKREGRRPDFSVIDWGEIKRGKFDSFLNDLKIHDSERSNSHNDDAKLKSERAFERFRYCNSCGGLPYVPYSLIEFSLTRDIPTLGELVKKLPLPVQTDMFCDALRVTGTIVARSPLHEWIILCSLQFAQLDHTCRVYDVCSNLFYPFYRLPDRWSAMQPQHLIDEKSHIIPVNIDKLRDRLPCRRHHLLHINPPSKWILMDAPPRFAHAQHRRSYCLLLRQQLQLPFNSNTTTTIPFPPSMSFSLLETHCWNWLEQQTAIDPIPPPHPSQQDPNSPLPHNDARSSSSSASSASSASSSSTARNPQHDSSTTQQDTSNSHSTSSGALPIAVERRTSAKEREENGEMPEAKKHVERETVNNQAKQPRHSRHSATSQSSSTHHQSCHQGTLATPIQNKSGASTSRVGSQQEPSQQQTHQKGSTPDNDTSDSRSNTAVDSQSISHNNLTDHQHHHHRQSTGNRTGHHHNNHRRHSNQQHHTTHHNPSNNPSR